MLFLATFGSCDGLATVSGLLACITGSCELNGAGSSDLAGGLEIVAAGLQTVADIWKTDGAGFEKCDGTLLTEAVVLVMVAEDVVRKGF